jgi:hypothetical protein
VYQDEEASCEIAVLVAKEEKPHSTEETVAKLCILRTAKIVLGESSEGDRTSVSTSSSSAKCLPPRCELLYATDTSYRKQDVFISEYPLH